MKNNLSLKIAWLYPDLMSTYGDRGNIIVLQKRCEWRGIKVEIVPIAIGKEDRGLKTADILLMGGAEDRQQQIVARDLKGEKEKLLKEKIEAGIPGLYICGAYQFLGKYYKEADGTIIDGLGILDVYTENPGAHIKRLVGNIAVSSNVIASEAKQSISEEKIAASSRQVGTPRNDVLVGFENHGGRTYLGKDVQPLGKVEVGFGNNGQDTTEGAIYKNSIGTYLHGPILPKNPLLTDHLIATALEVKYKKQIELEPLDDEIEQKAREVMLRKLKTL